MKKLFTLIAGILLASSASAQLRWMNLATNSDMEGEQSATWSSFWCHDWRQGVEFDEASGQEYAEPSANATVDNPPCMFMGFAEIVEDPTIPGNHCARVVIRTKEEADATGTATIDTGNNKPDWTEWDSQFFVYATEAIPEGQQVRLTLKIRGEKAGTLQTQAHWKPGDYNFYQLFGDVSYTTEWKTYTLGPVTVSSNHTQSGSGKEFQSVAFNLSTMQDGNTVYFDDIKLEVKDPEPEKEFEGWYNFLREGTLSKDVMPQNNQYTNFTGRNGIDGIDRPAEVVNDPVDGQPAMKVTTVIYEKTEEVPVLDEEGNPKLDEEGNPQVEEVKYWTKKFYNEAGEARDSLMASNLPNSAGVIQDWQTQFFVSIPHTLGVNQKYKVKFSARADIPTQIQSQVHANPGGYLWYEAIGNFDLTEDWQDFETEEMTISDNQKGTWTIAFNCNQGKEQEVGINNIYFRFQEFSVNSADVTEEEKVLASEDVIAEVPAKDADGTKMTIDVTKALEVLGLATAEDLLEGKAYVKVSYMDEEENVKWMDVQPDYYIDANGYYAEEGINIAYNEDDTAGNVVSFDIFNEGVDVTSTIATKLIFSVPEDATPEDGYARRAWSYEYNISLMGKEAYEEALAVTDVKTPSKKSGAIFDLSGRRVIKAAKGLYIKDGKKFFVK